MKKGFTLIELLVVVLIIGILSAIALPQYTKAVEKTRVAEAQTLLKGILAAEQAYQLATGDFTSDLTQLDLTMPGVSADSPSTLNTRNWKISVRTDNWENNDLTVWAVRMKSDGTALALEKGGYTLLLRASLSPNKAATLHCRNGLGDSHVPTICRALTNREDGYFY